MAIITTNDHHYRTIANAIREKAGTNRMYKPEEMPLGVAHAYVAGVAEGYNTGFSDGILVGENSSSGSSQEAYNRGFADGELSGNQWWVDLIKDKTDLNGFFKSGQFETIPDGLDFSNITSMSQTFMGCSKLKRLPYINSTNCTNFGYAFSGVGVINNPMEELSVDMRNATNIDQSFGTARIRNLKLIGNLDKVTNTKNVMGWSNIEEIHAYEDETMAVEIPLDLSSSTSTSTFANASSIRYFQVVPGSIKVSQNIGASNLLYDETIQSIIDGLADLTGQTAQTLTLHADVGAKLTQAQKDAVSAKNWTLVY